MYSYEERLKTVQLYIQYDKSYASVFRALGYPPSSHSIKLWYKEYEETGGLHKSYSSPSKYSDEQRKAAVQYYIEHGQSKSRTVKALGYPTRQQLTEWIKQDLPDEIHHCTKGQSLVHLSKEQKEQVAIELCTRDGSAQEIENLYNEAEDLKRTVYRLQLEKDVLEKAAEILKKDEGVSLEKLTNREKEPLRKTITPLFILIEVRTTVGQAGSRGWRMQALQDQCQKRAVLQAIPPAKASSDV